MSEEPEQSVESNESSDVPRISMEAFAQFCEATPAQQVAILRKVKFGERPPMSYYNEAKAAVRRWFLSQCQDDEIIQDKISQIETNLDKEGHSDNNIRRLNNNLNALNCALGASADLSVELGACVSVAAPESQRNHIQREGVIINVNPYLVTRSKKRGNGDNLGAFVAVFGRHDWGELGLKVMSALLYIYLETYCLGVDDAVASTKCGVLEVLESELHMGPGGIGRILNEVDQACRNIVLLWPTIT